ncbi:hypothetical protein WJX73_000083 [Symbiochloris irregularis]|uniref:Shikimate dehydrogenase (NADP(+)) n=1 Tax=Symbiochloris irregularis TaxID=706552 RepID=A0AAW1PIT7_9CHLO
MDRSSQLITHAASVMQSRDAESTEVAVSTETLFCTIATGSSLEEACSEISTARETGATAIELRLDFYKDLQVDTVDEAVQGLVASCRRAQLKSVFTCRAAWEGGKWQGSEEDRLHCLHRAAALGADFVDVELKAAAAYFEGDEAPSSQNCKLILSHHNFQSTPSDEELDGVVHQMFEAGADIAKVAAMAEDITDALRMLDLNRRSPAPCISLAMGDKGIISRLLAPKYGGFLTFGTLSTGKGSAPGQPPMQQMCSLYSLSTQTAATKVYGIVGNPVGHSRSPLLHNNGFQHVGLDAIYVPLLVDDLPRMLSHPLAQAFSGLSVTIPHKEAAAKVADEVDPTAAKIGAVNTLIRDQSDKLHAYNTDWSAAISAIEAGLAKKQNGQAESLQPVAKEEAQGHSPLQGRRVVMLGAGGAARALVLGALTAGAEVVVVNRNRARAEALVESAGGACSVADMQDLVSGKLQGDVLVQTTSVGMHPNVDDTPVPDKEVLRGFELVFDAIYTPLYTRLLQDAEEVGCKVVSGVEMFVGQALQQFILFTDGIEAPEGLFRQLVLEGLGH